MEIANKQVKRIYTGREGCRCGCRGNYFEIGSIGYKRALSKFQRLVDSPDVKVESGDKEYDDMTLPNGRVITLYYE
jgi:hypothetical protein